MLHSKFCTTAALLTAICTMQNTITPFAASLTSSPLENAPIELVQELNTFGTIKNIPEEVIGLFRDCGGKIIFEDNLSYQGEPVNGLYTAAGTEKDTIRVLVDSTAINYRENTAYTLAHELGHFIYFHTSRTDIQKNVLNRYYQKLKDSTLLKNFSIEEAFAQGYASYVNDGGYYLSEEEKELLGQMEEQIKDQYYTNHPDQIISRTNDGLLKDTWDSLPDWKKASFGPTVYYANEADSTS